jgi:hypothetical protein
MASYGTSVERMTEQSDNASKAISNCWRQPTPASKTAAAAPVTLATERFSQRTGIPLAIVFGVFERELKPRFETAKQTIDLK